MKCSRLFCLLAGLAGVLALSSCTVVWEESYPRPAPVGPPPWAPAHGYRRAPVYHYYYYPSSYVYFDTGRNVFFYIEGGAWRFGPVLPPHVRINIREAVRMDLDTDRPHTHWDRHRQSYPPHRDVGHGRDNRGRGGPRGHDDDRRRR